jgi:hypothetical protein
VTFLRELHQLCAFTASAGVFSPYQEFNSTGLSGTLTAHDQPGFQARLKYVGLLAPDMKLTAWTDGLTQQHRAEAGDAVFLAPGTNVRACAVDGGMRLDWGPVTLVGYGYYGIGLGTTGLFSMASASMATSGDRQVFTPRGAIRPLIV